MSQTRARTVFFVATPAAVALLLWSACAATERTSTSTAAAATATDTATSHAAAALGTAAHRDEVMRSRYCADCHPAIYAEHQQNTHGRAFTDPEVHLATGNFDLQDCIRCHTPRPIFETGIGLNPQRRWYGLEDGNSCMTCHWQPNTDYANFTGGPDCKQSFDPRVGTVEACATCHRNHGTPYQWEQAPNGKLADRTCVTCHMKQIERPVAVGGPVKKVRSHVFPGCRSVTQVAKAYDYKAHIEGNEVVVTVANTGAGHNFPTELKQRAVESLVVVRDQDGKEVARSRMVFRDPYKRPYGLHLQVNTQIPSGESRTHRVPIGVASGSVECELHFKYYYPIEDFHPDLARLLEQRSLPFHDITPNDKPVETDPEVHGKTPENIDPRIASIADFVDFTRPPIGKTTFDMPKGQTHDDIDQLIKLFQFPAAEANRAAIARLVAIGMPAVPQLVEALGSWDQKTFNAAIVTLRQIGAPAVPAISAALASDQLYIRFHARLLLEYLPLPADQGAIVAATVAALGQPHPLDRASACELLGWLGAVDTAPKVRGYLADADPDVVRAAANCLVRLGDREAVPALAAALQCANWPELRLELAFALTQLGDPSGVPVLLEGLDHADDLIREDAFERVVAATGQHLGFEPAAPHEERLAAIARLQAFWAERGGPAALQRAPIVRPATEADSFHVVETLGGGADIVPAAENDEAAIQKLVGLGEQAIPALIRGFKFPPGFAAKRASLFVTVSRLADRRMAAFVVQGLRDPVLAVAAYAALALETCGDAECVPALRRYMSRLRSAAASGQLPSTIPTIDPLLAQAARSRVLLGDKSATQDLVNLLLSDDRGARGLAIDTLAGNGNRRGYDPDGEPAARRAAAASWQP